MVLLPSGVAALLGTVGPHERGPSEASLDGALVHDQRILDVVPVVREDGDAEVLSGGPVGVLDVLHGLRLDHGHLGILHQVASGIGPDPVVGGGDSESLLTHSGTHGDTGGRVVLRIGNDSRRDTDDDHGVDLHVGVLRGHLGRHGELLSAPLALEDDVALLADVHPIDIGLGEGVVASFAGTPLRKIVRLHEDERVLLLLGVEPLDESLAEQVVPSYASLADAFDMLPGEREPSVLDDEQRPSETSLVAVDDDLSHLLVVADVDLIGYEPYAPALPDVGDEPGGIGMRSDEVSVDIDPGAGSGLDRLEVQAAEHPFHIVLGESLGDVDDQGGVLHQTAVLTFGGLGRAQPSPLGGVQVTGLEVGLAPGERGGDPPEVGHGGQIGRPVEKLGHSGAASDPVAGRERVEELVRQKVGTDGRVYVDDVGIPLPSAVPLELVLEILHEAAEAGPEQILHEIAGQFEPLVGVVVLVVLLPHAEAELQDGAGDASEEDGLLHTVVHGVSEVGQQGPVEDPLDLLGPVLLGLTGGEVPLEEQDGILGGVESVGRVGLLVERRLDVGVDDVGHALVGDDGLVDLLVLLHPQGLHQGDEGDASGCHGDGHHDRAVLLLLDEGERTVSVLLGEHLGDLHGGAVLLVVLDHHPVGGEVLESDQDPLGPSDNEVSSGLAGILPLPDELVLVLVIGERTVLEPGHHLAVQIASRGLHHHRKVSDVDPALVLGHLDLRPVPVDIEPDEDLGHVVEVPEPGLHRGELMAVSVRLGDGGRLDANGGLGLEIDVAVGIPLPAYVYLDVLAADLLGVERYDAPLGVVGRDADVVDDPLHPAVGIVRSSKEIVERRNVMADNIVIFEIQLY